MVVICPGLPRGFQVTSYSYKNKKNIKNVTRCREQISKKHRNKVGIIA